MHHVQMFEQQKEHFGDPFAVTKTTCRYRSSAQKAGDDIAGRFRAGLVKRPGYLRMRNALADDQPVHADHVFIIDQIDKLPTDLAQA